METEIKDVKIECTDGHYFYYREGSWLLKTRIGAEELADDVNARIARAKIAARVQDDVALALEKTEVALIYDDKCHFFNGTLLRSTDGTYKWSDATSETRIADRYFINEHSYAQRFAAHSDKVHGRVFIVPQDVIDRHPEMNWVLRNGYKTNLRDRRRFDETDPDGDMKSKNVKALVEVIYLVPAEHFYVWAYQLVGYAWETKHQGAIFEKAKSLGWTGCHDEIPLVSNPSELILQVAGGTR